MSCTSLSISRPGARPEDPAGVGRDLRQRGGEMYRQGQPQARDCHGREDGGQRHGGRRRGQ